MSKPVKTKLCWNCEGIVTRDSVNCKYCGVYLRRDDDHEDEDEEDEAPKSAFSALKNVIPRPPYVPEESSSSSSPAGSIPPTATVTTAAIKPQSIATTWKTILYPLICLSAGSVFLLFSFLLYFFSENGTLVLQWDAGRWLIYLVISLPLLLLGWRSLSQIED